MLKVLIADDEEHVCKLIEKLIKWEELGLRLVSVVHSGNAALEAYRSCSRILSLQTYVCRL